MFIIRSIHSSSNTAFKLFKHSADLLVVLLEKANIDIAGDHGLLNKYMSTAHVKCAFKVLLSGNKTGGYTMVI